MILDHIITHSCVGRLLRPAFFGCRTPFSSGANSVQVLFDEFTVCHAFEAEGADIGDGGCEASRGVDGLSDGAGIVAEGPLLLYVQGVARRVQLILWSEARVNNFHVWQALIHV